MTTGNEQKRLHRYRDIADESASNWGIRCESPADAFKDRRLSVADLGHAATLSILHKLNVVVSALVQEEIEERHRRQANRINEQYAEWLADREAAHGPMPAELESYFSTEVTNNVARASAGMWPYGFEKPPREMPELRKAYERWMKRKPPRQKKTIVV